MTTSLGAGYDSRCIWPRPGMGVILKFKKDTYDLEKCPLGLSEYLRVLPVLLLAAGKWESGEDKGR